MPAYPENLILCILMVLSLPSAAASVMGQLRAEQIATYGQLPKGIDRGTWYARQMLVQPDSPYSELVEHPEFTNDIAWQGTLANLSPTMDETHALARLQEELGMTRARPGKDIAPARGFRDPFVSANATKAGLDADIFWHMLDMFGYARAEHAASQAIGLQLLREQLNRVSVERREASGVYVDVMARVMRAQHPDQLLMHDLRYLDTLVQHHLLHPAVDTGRPTAWRIARAAAAFRDARGYVGGPPCLPDATPHPRYAGSGLPDDGRDLCLVAATDRAVHQWHVESMSRRAPLPPHSHGGMARIGLLLGALMPLLDIVALTEVIEAAVADDALMSDAIPRVRSEATSMRTSLLNCRIPE